MLDEIPTMRDRREILAVDKVERVELVPQEMMVCQGLQDPKAT
jgi:hypothetical protein